MKALSYGEEVIRRTSVRISSSHIVWTDQAKILAAFAVVMGHTIFKISMHIEDINSTAWWISNIYVSPLYWCVPVFVMASGAMILNPGRNESIATFYKKRAARILIPLIFWTIFYSFWMYFVGSRAAGNNEPITFTFLVKNIIMGQPFYHMWYLYMIVGLYLFAPFLRIIVKHFTTGELWYLCTAMFAFAIFSTLLNAYFPPIANSRIMEFVLYLPYFLAGYLIFTLKKDPPLKLVWGVFIASIAVTIIGNYFICRMTNSYVPIYFDQFLAIPVIAMSLSITFLFKHFSLPGVKSSLIANLALLSFGVYLIHPIIIDILWVNGIQVTQQNLLYSIPLIAIAVFLLSYGAAAIINKIPQIKRVI